MANFVRYNSIGVWTNYFYENSFCSAELFILINMRFTPEKYNIPDEPMKPFIDPAELWQFLDSEKPDKARVREIIAKSLAKNRLTLQETAALLNADDNQWPGQKK